MVNWLSSGIRSSAVLLCVVLAMILAVYASWQLSTSPEVVAMISSLGYVGVFIAAVIAGLNVVFPVPAATLTPLFVAAGMAIPLVIMFLALGTLVADLLGYLIGHTSRSLLENRYPKLTDTTKRLAQMNPVWLVLFVASYAAFMPLPNELILVPLAFAGVSWRLLIWPLFVGALIIQTLLVTGVTAIEVLF